jgi:arylsulfatase A-like enzyme
MKQTSALLVILLGLNSAWCPAAQPPERPNIVFILADDLGYADVGFTQSNGGEIKTPNLDRLASAGARLDDFYTLATCTPSRCSLMTGRYPIRYGRQFNVLRPGQQVGLSLAERLLPQALREAGYATAHVGKWHLGDFDPAYRPLARGFDHTYGFIANQKRYTHLLTGGHHLQRNEEPVPDEGSMTDLLTREAVRLIEERDPAKPLFLYVAYHAPHTPLECPPEFSKPYEHLGPTRKYYAGLVAEMDAGVGRIVETIGQQGMRSNTLFIFASDNGGLTAKGDIARNTPFRAGKGSLYEGGVRVVAFATMDGHIPAGSTIQEPLHMVDWYPTLLQLAGASLEQPLPLDGRDAWPTITEGKPSPHHEILMNTVGREGAIRSGDWKLVRNGSTTANEDTDTVDRSGGREAKRKAKREAAENNPDVIELFNLAKDPAESVNLADEETERVRELTNRLDAFAGEAVPPILKPGEEMR